MAFERGNRNSALKAANTICSNKETYAQEQLSGGIQPSFPLQHLLLTAEKSIALKATTIKLMGNVQTAPNSSSHSRSLSPTALSSSSLSWVQQ